MIASFSFGIPQYAMTGGLFHFLPKVDFWEIDTFSLKLL